MKRTGLFHAWEIWTGIGITFAMVLIACHLPALDPPSSPIYAETILSRLLSSSRKAFGADFYRRADEYYHRGIAFTRPTSFAHDPFRRLLDIVSPETHAHVAAQETVEVIPWLRFTTAMDPHNVEAFLVTSYLLQAALHKPDMADDVLVEAQRANPGNYLVALERGRLALRRNRTEQAVDFFDMAIRLWPGAASADPIQLRLDRAEMLTYRALLHEYFNEPGKAAAMLQEVVTLFPERRHLAARIVELQNSGNSFVSATRLWKGMLSAQGNPHICSREQSLQGKKHADQDDDHCSEGHPSAAKCEHP